MATGNNNIYFVEQALENYNGEKLLVNKQIIKTGIDDIPNSYLSTITKKQSKNDFLADLNKVRKEHAQSVNQFYSTNSIRNDSEKIKMSDEKSFSARQEESYSCAAEKGLCRSDARQPRGKPHAADDRSDRGDAESMGGGSEHRFAELQERERHDAERKKYRHRQRREVFCKEHKNDDLG